MTVLAHTRPLVLSRTEKDWAWKAIDRERSTWERKMVRAIQEQFRIEGKGVATLLARDGAALVPGTEAVILPPAVEVFLTLQGPAWAKILWIAWRECRVAFGIRQAEALGGKVLSQKAGPTVPFPKPSPDVWVDDSNDSWVFDPARPAAENAASTWVAEKVVRVTTATKDGIRARVLDGLQNGKGIEEIAKGIQGEGPFSKHRAHRIARTEVVAASNYGHREAAVQSGVIMAKQWISSRDERVRHSHRTIDDETERTPIDLNTPYVVGGAQLMFPGDPAGPAKEVIHCFPGETQVVPNGRIEKAFQRFWTGDLVRIRTRNHDLAGTPNHPVATPRGWVPLGLLQEGDHVLTHPVQVEEMPSRDPDVEDGPTPIAEVFRSGAGLRPPTRIPGTDVDFHGDGTDREVEVVGADGFLGLDHETPGLQPFPEEGLAVPDLRLGPGSGLGKAGEVLGGVPGSSPSLMSTSDQDLSVPSEGSGDRGFRLPREVATEEILGIDRVRFSGYVYTLQTSEGSFWASGVLVHNCRCAEGYVHKGRFKPTRPMPDDWDRVEEFPSTELVPQPPEPPAPAPTPAPAPVPPPAPPGPEDNARRRTDTPLGKKVEKAVQKAKASVAKGLTTPKEIQTVGKVIKTEVDKRLREAAEASMSRVDKERLRLAREKVKEQEKITKALAKAGKVPTDPELARALWDLEKATTRVRALEEVPIETRRAIVLEVLEEVRAMGDGMVPGIDIAAGYDPRDLGRLRKAWKMLPEDWFKEVQIETSILTPGAGTVKTLRNYEILPVHDEQRAFFRPPQRSQVVPVGGTPKSWQAEIVLSRSAADETVLHESGHMMEDRFRHLAEASNALLDARSLAGSGPDYQIAKMSDLTGDSGYEAHEVAIKDKWAHPYIGSIYGHRPVKRRRGAVAPRYKDPTEILSMGLESVFYDRFGIWAKDPDFMEWTLGVLGAL